MREENKLYATTNKRFFDVTTASDYVTCYTWSVDPVDRKSPPSKSLLRNSGDVWECNFIRSDRISRIAVGVRKQQPGQLRAALELEPLRTTYLVIKSGTLPCMVIHMTGIFLEW